MLRQPKATQRRRASLAAILSPSASFCDFFARRSQSSAIFCSKSQISFFGLVILAPIRRQLRANGIIFCQQKIQFASQFTDPISPDIWSVTVNAEQIGKLPKLINNVLFGWVGHDTLVQSKKSLSALAVRASRKCSLNEKNLNFFLACQTNDYSRMRSDAIQLRHRKRRIGLAVAAIVSACAAIGLLFGAGIAALIGHSVSLLIAAAAACGAIAFGIWRRM